MKRPDPVLLGLLAVIVAVGFVLLTSASGPTAFQKFNDASWYLGHQALFGLLPGLLLFTALSHLDYRRLRTAAVPLFVAALALLSFVFAPGVGAEWGSSKSWLSIGAFSLQPAEIAKFAIIVFLASAFARASAGGRFEARQALPPLLASVGACGALLMLQPDLGGFIVIAAVAVSLYFLAGAPLPHLAVIGAVGIAAVFVLIQIAPYRADRFTTFLHPELDPQGRGYHINQAYLAIGSGGLLGSGLGHSRQKFLYLPEVVGDSIFAVAAEELGFLFTAGLVALFAALVLRGVRIARGAPDDFSRLLVAGVVAWVFFQTLFNIGSMLGLMPITGLTLPFISYGGTALLSLLAAMGVVANVSRYSIVR